ncbi:MAG TPA: hypothetical protein VLF40_06775 [Candidatus Saccharimonadales bacterium]|nr:hypothetical protein [Candidatus Saccharimonadales bacterium]
MPRGSLPIKKLGQKGFSVVEVLLATTLFGFLVVAVIGAVIYGRASAANAGERMRATQIADEGVEVLRNLRDGSFTNLNAGTYGLQQSGGQWSLSGTSDTTGIFTRTLTITNTDGNRRAVTVTVTWPQGSSTAQLSVSSELTNWAAVFNSWSGYDAPGTDDALKVASSGHYVYLVRGGSSSPNFLVIDVANPTLPTLVASLTLAGSPTNITLSGNTAFVANSDRNNILQIINISSPTAPSLTKTFSGCAGSAGALGIAVDSNLVYLGRSANGGNAELCIVDVSSLSSPTLAASYSNNVNMYAIYIPSPGNDAYIATSSDTQEIIAVQTQKPKTGQFDYSYDLTGTADAMNLAGFGNNLLVGRGSTLYALDHINQKTLSVSGSIAISGTGVINDIALNPSNTTAYLAATSSSAEFQIVNISSLTSMSIVKTTDVPAVLNGLSYVTSNNRVAAASASDTQELMLFPNN